jgi:hypothetical protein
MEMGVSAFLPISRFKAAHLEKSNATRWVPQEPGGCMAKAVGKQGRRGTDLCGMRGAPRRASYKNLARSKQDPSMPTIMIESHAHTTRAKVSCNKPTHLELREQGKI